MRAFVFPGQGSQFAGMGKDLADAFPAARAVFDEVDDALSQKLSTLMFDGGDDLNLTENTQPALMAVSVAVARVLQQEKPDLLTTTHCKYVAGHSLGEYAALTAAGSFALADAARLLKLRGQEMQKAVPVGVGAMAAIIGMDMPDVTALTQESSTADSIVVAANDNSFGQVVISGHKDAVERAMKLATERGAKRALLLPVSAPFHCPLMMPAAEAMAVALATTHINAPSVTLVANVTAGDITAPDDIRRLLVEQVTGTVRWRESVLFMQSQGVTETVELGAGKVLSGLTKRIHADMTGRAINTPHDIEDFAKSLSS